MTTHHLHLHDHPFQLIRSGRKTVESRLFDSKRQALNVGDTLIFTHRETGEEVATHITHLERFPDFKTLLETIPLSSLGAKNAEKELGGLRKYYSPEEEHRYGVIAISLQKIDTE